MLIGYIILGTFLLIGLATPLLLWREYARNRPKHWVGTIGVRWQLGAVQPWENFDACVHRIQDYVKENHPEHAKRFCDTLWIDVLPADALIKGKAIPTGVLTDGRELAGLYEVESYFVGLLKKRRVQIRQVLSTNGKLLGAHRSALFHEVAEHHLPLILTGNDNAGHDPKWLGVTRAMAKPFRPTK